MKAFDKETMTTPEYKDVKIAFKVTEPTTSDRILINYAQKMVSTANGTITIEVTPGKTNNEMTLAGLGICK